MESIEKIRSLLERFYQGESTLAEEHILEEFFLSSTVPADLLADKDLFQALHKGEDEMEVPATLNNSIIDTLDHQVRKEKRSRRISLYSMSGLAAGILALVAVYVFFLKDNEPALLAENHMEDTYSDPRMAYEEARETLAFVSGKLNRGTKEFKHVQQVTRVSTEPLRSLSKMNSGKQELILLGKLQRVTEIEN